MPLFNEPISSMAHKLCMTQLLTLALLTFPPLHMLKPHHKYTDGFHTCYVLAFKYTSFWLFTCLALSYPSRIYP